MSRSETADRLGGELRPRPQRRGTMLIELIMAAVVVGGLMFLGVETLAWTIQQRREAEQRVVAIEEVSNQLDQWTSLRWSEITPERLENSRLSEETRAILPNALLDARIEEMEGERISAAKPIAAAKRITVSIAWNDRSGQRGSTVRMTAWKYHHRGE